MGKSIAEAYIIVVEDDQNDQLITLDFLRMAGANRCFVRRDVDTAVSFAERLPAADLFLVDINIPNRSGYEMLAEVRLHEKLNNAKVVAITAGTQAAEAEKARELGFDGFIAKPLKPEIFPQQVQEILDGGTVWETR